MKRLAFAVSALAVFLTLALTLAGCPNAAEVRHQAELDADTGSITLRFGAPAGRTLLPETFVFAAHRGTFYPVGYPDREPVPVPEDLAEPIILRVGDWKLEIDLYAQAGDASPVAAGELAFTVLGGEDNEPLVVPIVFAPMAGSGTFTWDITHQFYASLHQGEIILEYLGADPRANISILFELADLATPAGTRAVPAGFYLVTVRMEMDAITPLYRYVNGEYVHVPGHFTGARRAIWSDVLHVYPGQTTPLAHGFAAGDYFHAVAEAWLFGHMTDWNLGNLDGKAMTLQSDGTLVWEGNLWGRPGGYYFRFSLTDTSQWDNAAFGGYADGNRRRGAWFVPTDPNGDDFDMAFMRLHHTDVGEVSRTWNTDVNPGFYQITLDPIEREFDVERLRPVDVANVWIVGSFLDGNWSASLGHEMEPDNGTFTWSGHVPAGGSFRFSLLDTTGQTNPWDGIWLAPDSVNAPAGVDAHDNMTRVTGITNNSWRIAAAGYYVLTVDLNAFKLIVERPVTVTGLEIVGAPSELHTRSDFAFAHRLDGINYNAPNVEVRWTLDRVSGTLAAGTGFGIGGTAGNVLTIAADEAPGPIIVTASVYIDGIHEMSDATGHIQIRDADTRAMIQFYVDDQGRHVGIVGGVPSEDPVLALTGADNYSVIFSVLNPDPGHEYQWLVGNRDFDGEVLVIDRDKAADYGFGIGRHQVRLVVLIDGVPWSMSDPLHFRVVRGVPQGGGN